MTLLCCCLLSSALVSLRGPGAPPLPLLALNVVPLARAGLAVLPTLSCSAELRGRRGEHLHCC